MILRGGDGDDEKKLRGDEILKEHSGKGGHVISVRGRSSSAGL
jgi:hypothetical protein